MSPRRRRLERLLASARLRVDNVAPGTVLLTRVGAGSPPEVVPAGPGAALVLRPDVVRDHSFEHERELGAHLLATHLATVFRMYDVNCVLDVGANKGQYVKRLRAAGYRGHVVSFEPVPRDFAALSAAAAADPTWTVHQMALGRTDTTMAMHVVAGTMSSLLPPTSFGERRYERFQHAQTEEVPVRRLAGLLDEVTAGIDRPRTYLKMDTQGYDLEVFAGLGERVRDIVALQSEVSLMQIYAGMPPMAQAIEAYEAAGFGVTALYPVSRQSSTGRVLEYDCVMVRPSARRGG